MRKKHIYFTWLSILCIPTLTGCATDPEKVEQHQRMYESRAIVNDKVAEDMRNIGNERMAEYYNQEAEKERHNSFATDCGTTRYFIFSIIDSDACQTK